MDVSKNVNFPRETYLSKQKKVEKLSANALVESFEKFHFDVINGKLFMKHRSNSDARLKDDSLLNNHCTSYIRPHRYNSNKMDYFPKAIFQCSKVKFYRGPLCFLTKKTNCY